MSDYECEQCGQELAYPPNKFHTKMVCDTCFDRLESML